MPIKLIAADMDGTLLTSDQTITKKTEDAIRKAHKAGIEFVLNSGRSNSECEAYYHQLPVRYSILANGAYITDRRTGADILSLTIPVEDARKIYGIYAGYESIIFVQGEHWVYAAEDFKEKCRYFPEYTVGYAPIELPYRYVADLGAFLDERTDDVEKFHVSFISHEEAENAYAELIKLPYKVVWCGTYCVEVTHPDADKGRALEMLANTLGIKREEVMAIGDSENDESMLKYAGVSVVVDNAPERLKETSDMVAASHDDDGVAQAIEKILKG